MMAGRQGLRVLLVRRARMIGAVLLLAAVALATGDPPAGAQEAPQPAHPITQRAIVDLGSYQGECWPWVRIVVLEATGRQMGFGYREGFFEGGAEEILLEQAAEGDIIQIADDEDAGPGVDYPGLHTAIVLANHGDGTFTIIDSNSQWDGIVRIREGYDPLAAAARYPYLDVHAYRFPLAKDSFPGAEPPDPRPPSFTDGDLARVNANGDCLNLRAGPSLGQAIIRCIPDGTVVDVTGSPSWSGGRYWLPVSVDGLAGWVAAEFVAPARAAKEDPKGAAAEQPGPPFRAVVPLIAVS